MSRRARRRQAAAPPTGPLDPWTGLPGQEQPSLYSPEGQIASYGRFAQGLTREPRSRSGYRRTIVDVGIWFVIVPLLVIAMVVFISSLVSSGG